MGTDEKNRSQMKRMEKYCLWTCSVRLWRNWRSCARHYMGRKIQSSGGKNNRQNRDNRAICGAGRQ